MEVSYGIQAKDTDDKYLEIGERAVEGPVNALVLGALWVEFFPIYRTLWRILHITLNYPPNYFSLSYVIF